MTSDPDCIVVTQCSRKLCDARNNDMRPIFQEGDRRHDPTFEKNAFKGVQSFGKIGWILIPQNYLRKRTTIVFLMRDRFLGMIGGNQWPSNFAKCG